TRFLAFILLLVLTATAKAAQGPKEQVETTVSAVLGVLKDGSMERETRRDKIRALIQARFDFRTMSQRTLATYWKKATVQEQDRFVELFSRLLEWTYIGRIEAYSNETVKYTGERIKKDRALVDTFIVTASTDIPIDYKLLKNGNQWLVYDVIIEQVSLVRNYRGTYRSIVKRHGIGGLLEKMEQKIQQMKENANSAEKKT
ncbi:MAG: ABC transporter substrate-binding protein, partial [Pseudomonadota bacterium]